MRTEKEIRTKLIGVKSYGNKQRREGNQRLYEIASSRIKLLKWILD